METLTIPQMIARNNREVRMRRLGLQFDKALYWLVIGLIYAGAALAVVLLAGEGALTW